VITRDRIVVGLCEVFKRGEMFVGQNEVAEHRIDARQCREGPRSPAGLGRGVCKREELDAKLASSFEMRNVRIGNVSAVERDRAGRLIIEHRREPPRLLSIGGDDGDRLGMAFRDGEARVEARPQGSGSLREPRECITKQRNRRGHRIEADDPPVARGDERGAREHHRIVERAGDVHGFADVRVRGRPIADRAGVVRKVDRRLPD
jgi:hypothetical protein